LVETTQQPKYTDALSTWISVYTPIKNAAGATVGAIGVDYDIAYVNKVYDDVVRVLYPVLAIAYVVLLGLVYWLSGSLTRRLARLSTATKRVSEGDYEVDLSNAAKSRIDDEMTELAKSFAVMTEKVGARERKLVAQVAVLKVEIDQKKRQQAVAEITDTDFFSELTAKADLMRAKVKADEAESVRKKSEDSGGSDD
jgi:signal transduction histidine kinase